MIVRKKIPVKRPELKILCGRVTRCRKAEWEGGHEKKELPALYTVFYSQETQGPGAPSIIHTSHVECIEKHKSASLELRPHL